MKIHKTLFLRTAMMRKCGGNFHEVDVDGHDDGLEAYSFY